MSKPFIYTLQTEVTLKKYKDTGMTLREIIESDIDYVKWLYREKIIKMDRESFEFMCEKAGRPQKTKGKKSIFLR